MTETKTEKPLKDRLDGLIDDMVEQQLLTGIQNINKIIAGAISKKQVEAQEVIDASYSVSKATQVNFCDLHKTLRKAMLENSESGKKTPVAVEKAGPEGTASKDPFTEMLAPFEGGKKP
jgi:hypothetical protein